MTTLPDRGEPVMYESHMHTPLCRHAVGDPSEYAEMALLRGLKGMIVTCHNPLPAAISEGPRMRMDEFDDYVSLVARTRDAYAGRLDVRLGLEADYWPGLEPFLEGQLASQAFHYVLGSVHPHLRHYQKTYFAGDPVAFAATYFGHLAVAAETGLFDALSHPDLVKNVFPDQWDAARVMPAVRKALDRIAATGVAMELNTSGLQKAIPEMNPGPAILREMSRRGIPVVLGADAHEPRRVAADYEPALDLLEAAGYREVRFFLERKPHRIGIGAARRSLRKPVEAMELQRP